MNDSNKSWYDLNEEIFLTVTKFAVVQSQNKSGLIFS